MSPRSASSIMRSIMETGKVTPAAFTVWRSMGASSCFACNGFGQGISIVLPCAARLRFGGVRFVA